MFRSDFFTGILGWYLDNSDVSRCCFSALIFDFDQVFADRDYRWRHNNVTPVTWLSNYCRTYTRLQIPDLKQVQKHTEITHLIRLQNILENYHFLPPDTHTYVCVSGDLRNVSCSKNFANVLNEWSPWMFLCDGAIDLS